MKIPMTTDCTPFLPIDAPGVVGNTPVMAGNTMHCNVCKGDHLVVAYLRRDRPNSPPNAVGGVASELLFQYCPPYRSWVLAGFRGRRMAHGAINAL
tara:strand:- start:9745 stop:10032 length:288 start_codon:yes stop_codon:yes gene_type:complete